MNKQQLERIRKNNLQKLDSAYRDDRHINCVRFGKNESISHKLAKCISGILASEGVPIENIENYFAVRINNNEGILKDVRIENYKFFVNDLKYYIQIMKTSDNQDFIQEARFIRKFIPHSKIKTIKQAEIIAKEHFIQRRADYYQIQLDKILEFETDKKVKKEGAITVRI